MDRALVAPSPLYARLKTFRAPSLGRIEEVNKELWLLLSIFGLCLLLNYVVSSGRMILSFYTFPTLVSAFTYGRRHATLTAFASVLIVILVTLQNPAILVQANAATFAERWLDVTAWGSMLIITGYL